MFITEINVYLKQQNKIQHFSIFFWNRLNANNVFIRRIDRNKQNFEKYWTYSININDPQRKHKLFPTRIIKTCQKVILKKLKKKQLKNFYKLNRKFTLQVYMYSSIEYFDNFSALKAIKQKTFYCLLILMILNADLTTLTYNNLLSYNLLNLLQMQNTTLSYHAFSPFLNRECNKNEEPSNFDWNKYPYKCGLFYSFLLSQGIQHKLFGLKQRCESISTSEIEVKSQNTSYEENIKENQIKLEIPEQIDVIEQKDTKKPQIKQKKVQKKIKKSKKHIHQYSDEEQEFSPHFSKKNCESKNITKNFGKAIIGFIFRQIHIVERVLEPFGIQRDQFLHKTNELKDKVASIHALRELWMEQYNEYAKIFRILSSIFLRKHSLNHIFYSRVTNHSRNIKYRKKILEGLNKPSQFTLIKQY